MPSDKAPEGLRSFAAFVCLLYHEARNVRHLVRAGALERGTHQWLLYLPNNRAAAWAELQGFRLQAARTESALAACDVFARRFRLTLEDLVELFENDAWHHSAYGGNRWSGVARSVIELRNALEAGDPVGGLIEAIAGMSHNTGRVGDKLRALDTSLGK